MSDTFKKAVGLDDVVTVDFNPRNINDPSVKSRSDGAFDTLICTVPMELSKINVFPPWIEIHGYNIGRTYGSFKFV